MGHSPRGCKEADTTERLTLPLSLSCRHIPFCTFGKSVPGYVVSLKLVMPHSAHWG